MSDSISPELSSVLAALRSELDDTRRRLAALEKVVCIYEEDGHHKVLIECNTLCIRPAEDPRYISVQLGSDERQGYLMVYGSTGDPHCALFAGINENDTPVVRLQGPDVKARVLLTVEKDHGTIACFAPGYKPGTVMRAIPGGGSFGVLQSDGKARGVLIHSDGTSEPDGKPSTKLLFATADASNRLSLHADDEGSMIALSQTDAPNCATLVAHKSSTGLVLHSPGKATSAVVMASAELARIMTFTGEDLTGCSQAALTSSAQGGSLTLNRPDATTAILAKATDTVSFVSLQDRDDLETIAITEGAGLHCLNIYVPGSKTKSIALGSTDTLAYARISCPAQESLQLITMATGTTVTSGIFKDDRPLTLLSHGENGGNVSAYGNAESPGFAALSGQKASASVAVSSADGTALAGLGANDHGGQVTLNNDIGFPRIFMAIHEESSVVTLNHTGQKGIDIIAGPKGGILLVHDEDGKVVESLTGFDTDD